MAAFTHAGGIVFRQRGGRTEYLIVRAKPHPSHWVIPKGHIEPGESPEAAASREVLEEAGVITKIIAPLGRLTFTYRGKKIETIVYLMEYLAETQAQEERGRHWGVYEAALELLTFPDTREMLGLAQEMVRQRTGQERG